MYYLGDGQWALFLYGCETWSLTSMEENRVRMFENREEVKKSVPLHAMEAHGGRGGIAPTHT
jgi:hypothetical protein